MTDYKICDHDVIEKTAHGETFRTALCSKCGTTFFMCGTGCPNHVLKGGAWHYLTPGKVPA